VGCDRPGEQMIAIGGILGGFVGEMQVLMIEQFGR
jgi:hypothetical protein